MSLRAAPLHHSPPLTDIHRVTIENMVATRWSPLGQGALVWSIPFIIDLTSHRCLCGVIQDIRLRLCLPPRKTIRCLLLVLRLQQEVLQVHAVPHRVRMMNPRLRSSTLASQTCLPREVFVRYPVHRWCLIVHRRHCRTNGLVK